MTSDSRQPNLWSSSDFQVTVAEAALLHFTAEYRLGLRESNPEKPLPRWMDEHSYACILLCEEHGEALTEASVTALQKCQDDVAARPMLYDMQPWNVALHALGKAPYALDGVVGSFTNGGSGIRAFMFEIGWFVRRRLPVEETTERLLQNVADTLGHWGESLGLCSYLFETEEQFWAFAHAYQPDPRFEEQYRDRLQTVRDAGLGLCRYHFALLEANIRRLIDGFALGLTCGRRADGNRTENTAGGERA